MEGIDNSRRYKIEVCDFGLKIILESLNGEMSITILMIKQRCFH